MKPNIVLILADDMGYGDFGRFNDGHVRTPTLDQLVDESVCLTQHYSGSPVCSPARAALLTGRYPLCTGVLGPQEVLGLDRMGLDEVTLGDLFQAAGYTTGMVGKWHNGALDPRHHPNARGFDEFVGFRGGWSDYFDWRLDVNGAVRNGDGRYLTRVFSDEAVGFIRRHRQDPFLLCVMYSAPHSPLQAPAEMVQPYLEMGLAPGVAMTYAMIEVMDQGIQLILEELKRQGLDENTIVLFSSDNGPAFRLRADQVPPGMDLDTRRFNCGFAGAKGSVHEGGIRVPMVVRWPAGLPRGTRVNDLIHFTDWLPTLTAMAGIVVPDSRPLDGQNMLPVLRGEAPAVQPHRFWQWNSYTPIGETNAAIRDGPWKLVRPQMDLIYASEKDRTNVEYYVTLDIAYKKQPETIRQIVNGLEPAYIIPEPEPPELYHIDADPQERQNLAAVEPIRMARMLTQLESWFEAVEGERRLCRWT